jgi:hypothetical protein
MCVFSLCVGDASLFRSNSGKLPGDAFALSTQSIWEVIRSQKDLNLPAHKIMVAGIRCTEIKEEQLRCLQADQAWLDLKTRAESEAVAAGFGSAAAALVDSCVKGYVADSNHGHGLFVKVDVYLGFRFFYGMYCFFDC